MSLNPLAQTLLRVARRLGSWMDKLPFDAGSILRRTQLLRFISSQIANDGGRIDPKLSAPLCVLPWMHTQIETTGDVQLCCVAHSPNGAIGNVHRDSVMKIFHSEAMNTIRNQMMSGQWPTDCVACRDRETMKLQSFRQSSNQSNSVLFQELVSGAVPALPRIRSIDVRLNNLCNFKCRSCHGFASNRWFNEHNLVFPDNKISMKYHGFAELRSFWEDFEYHILPSLESIHIAGGEPLITDSHYHLLEKLISAKKTNVELQYDTNLSCLKFKHWDVIELWRNFPNLVISASLDGVGRKGEFIREGLHYEEWVTNIRRLQRELPHAKRNLHFVVSIFNVIDFPEHYKAIAEAGFVEPNRMNFTFLEWPAYLSPQILMPELKRKAEQNICKMLSSNLVIPPSVRSQIEALVEFLKAKDLYELHGEEFVINTRVLDQARGQNTASLFPDLEPMLRPTVTLTAFVGTQR